MSDYTATPFIDEQGDLRIPFDADPKFHHWKGGQSILATLKEINAPMEVFRNFLLPEAFEKFLAEQQEKGIGQSA